MSQILLLSGYDGDFCTVAYTAVCAREEFMALTSRSFGLRDGASGNHFF